MLITYEPGLSNYLLKQLSKQNHSTVRFKTFSGGNQLFMALMKAFNLTKVYQASTYFVYIFMTIIKYFFYLWDDYWSHFTQRMNGIVYKVIKYN